MDSPLNSQSKEINVVFATDRRGVLGCAVSGRSILEHLPSTTPICFWVLDWNLTAEDHRRIAETFRGTAHHAAVGFVPIDVSLFKGLLHSRAIPPVSYARLLLGEFLPIGVERCIYIDIDTVCTANVEKLYHHPLDGGTVGAVINGDGSASEQHFLRLGIEGDSYFGAGVMLCDLHQWRSERIGEQALAFARDAGHRLILHDQDALNAVLRGSWAELPERWNRWAIANGSQVDCITHFTMSPKPWHADYIGPGKDLFYSFVDRTAYERYRPWNPLGLGRVWHGVRRRIPYGPTVFRMLQQRLR